MTPNLMYLVLVAVMYAAGVYLLLDRSLTRVLLGVLVLSNATNVLLLGAGGPAGEPPIVGGAEVDDMTDPLPQAMILTAIVITLGIAAFVLALILRSWVLDNREDVVDDPEDKRIATRRVQPDSESQVEPGEPMYDTGEDLGRVTVADPTESGPAEPDEGERR